MLMDVVSELCKEQVSFFFLEGACDMLHPIITHTQLQVRQCQYCQNSLQIWSDVKGEVALVGSNCDMDV